MATKTKWFSLKGEDLKLLLKFKKQLLHTHGKLTNVGAIRIALLKVTKDNPADGNEA